MNERVFRVFSQVCLYMPMRKIATKYCACFFLFGSDEQAIELVREKTILLLVDEKEMYAHERVATREREKNSRDLFLRLKIITIEYPDCVQIETFNFTE